MRSLPLYVRALLLTALLLATIPMDVATSAASTYSVPLAQSPSVVLTPSETSQEPLNWKVMLPSDNERLGDGTAIWSHTPQRLEGAGRIAGKHQVDMAR